MSYPAIHRGSILESQADAIVNPANSFLRHGAGLARIIADAAGPRGPAPPGSTRERAAKARQWRDEQRDAPLIPTGAAHVTTGGLLAARWVIHVVGPIWGGGEYEEEKLLYLAHRSALHAAAGYGLESVAFPAISCGLFGFPVERAARIAVRALTIYGEGFGIRTEVYLMEDAHVLAYRAAVADLTSEREGCKVGA